MKTVNRGKDKIISAMKFKLQAAQGRVDLNET